MEIKTAIIGIFLLLIGSGVAMAQTCFEWTPNTEPIIGYKIYQDPGQATAVEFDRPLISDLLTFTPDKCTSCIDAPKDSLAHRYAATAYASGGVESDYSEHVDIKPVYVAPPAISQPPVKVGGFIITTTVTPN